MVHSPLVEGVVLGISLKGAFLNYEAHLGVNNSVRHLIPLLPRSFTNSSFLLRASSFPLKTRLKVNISAAAAVVTDDDHDDHDDHHHNDNDDDHDDDVVTDGLFSKI